MKTIIGTLYRWLRCLLWVTFSKVGTVPTRNFPTPAMVKRVLVIHFGALGDGIMIGPFLRQLRSRYPGAEIQLLTNDGAGKVFAGQTVPDVVRTLRPRNPLQLALTWHRLRRYRFDLAADCTSVIASACLCRSLNPRYSVGFQRRYKVSHWEINTGFQYAHATPYTDDAYFPKLVSRLLPEDTRSPRNDALKPVYRIPSSEQSRVRQWCQKNGLAMGNFIVLAPGAKWPPRRWPERHWAALCRSLSILPDGPVPVFVGAASDKELIHRISSGCGFLPLSLIAADLFFLAALMEAAAAVVCNDSFAMHLAFAVDCQTVCIFGPGAPQRTAWKSEKTHVLYSEEFCSPCRQYYTADRCWRGMNFCLERISPEAVLDRLTHILSGRALQ